VTSAATDVAPTRSLGSGPGWRRPLRWIEKKDPGLLAVKRSVRAAVVMPSVFGLTHALFSNPQVGLFGSFGSFALLLLVDFPGRPRTRLVSYLALFVVGGCFVTLGTVVSTQKVAAVAAMAVVGFLVLLAGTVSPQAATASTGVLLTFVLPVAVAQPVAAVGPRLIGWAFAGAVGIPACMVLWPTPWHDSLRTRLSSAISAVSRVVRARAQGGRNPDAQAALDAEMSLLRDRFAATPYPPTGAAATAVALAKLVGRVQWVASSMDLVSDHSPSDEPPPVRALLGTVAETLDLSGSLVCDGRARPDDDPSLARSVKEAVSRMEQQTAAEVDAEVSMVIDPDTDSGAPSAPRASAGTADEEGIGIASSLDPTFHVRGLSIATAIMADAALEAAGAQSSGDRRMGGAGTVPPHQTWARLASYLSVRSVSFRNAVRGAAGLALAVAVVEVTDVEHGFWVVLGTLSVLRSNALGTGSTALRAIGGTAVGFVVGSVIMIGLASHLVLLWVLLPLAVLVSGVAPSMISFAAGQAGFTVVVVILFNIIDPQGWKVGLTRIEDVAIGCAVSVVVGLLFWPRGATAALGRALSDSYAINSGYLVDAVDRLTSTTRVVDTLPAQRAAHVAYLRLDDAFRQCLAERGAKAVPIETLARLFTSSNRIRLAAYTLATLPTIAPAPGQSELESVAIAGAVLRDSYASSHRWYEEFGELLSGRRSTLDPAPMPDEALHDVLREAFDDARHRRRGDRLRAILQMLWADQLLETQHTMQVDLAGSVDLFASGRHTRPFV
jgi:uncharacterized membrane protein YccC